MWTMCCSIKVGKYLFNRVHQCSVKKSLHILGATAVIELPMSMYVDKIKKNFIDFVHVNDPVEIKLGYDDNPILEFSGYVSKVNDKDSILNLECEDNIYKLRSPVANKSWQKAKLAEVVSYIAKACNVEYDAKNIPDIDLNPGFPLKNCNGIQAINILTDSYPVIQAFFDDDGKLVVCMNNAYRQAEVKYAFDKNIISNNLEFKKAEDQKIQVQAISILKNNQRIIETAGDKDGAVRTLYYAGIEDSKQLKALADADIKRYKYTGFSGSFTSFLLPIARIGGTANITDPKHNRSGSYLIESTEVSFSREGGRRTIELGIDLSIKT